MRNCIDAIARFLDFRLFEFSTQQVNRRLQTENFTFALLDGFVGFIATSFVLLVMNFALGVSGTIREGACGFHAETALIAIIEVSELTVAVVIIVHVIVVDSVIAFILKLNKFYYELHNNLTHK